MAIVNANPTVTVPVAAINFLNHAVDLLGEAVSIELTRTTFYGPEELAVLWQGDVPQHIKDRVEAAADEVNRALEEHFPLLLGSEATGHLALVMNI